MARTVAVIGSTGSIGTQTLDVLKRLKESEQDLRPVALSANTNPLIEQQIETHRPVAYAFSRELENIPSDIRYYPDSVSLIRDIRPDITVIASSGGESLRYTRAAIENSKRVCIANKESLVLAGEFIVNLARKKGVALIPVDSEHSGVFQLLENESRDAVSRVIITASGGALREWPPGDLKKATVTDVLKHPNWDMGAKITVDSATLFNKGLEIIEAKHLFGLKKEQIVPMFCYSSYIHALVEMKDGTIKIHSGHPDMRIPIAYSLTRPERASLGLGLEGIVKDKLKLKDLEIENHRAIRLVYEIYDMENAFKIVYNAANEAAVELFLNKKIGLSQIFDIVESELKRNQRGSIDRIDDILNFHEEIKQTIYRKYKWRERL